MSNIKREELREKVTALLWGGRTDVDGILQLIDQYTQGKVDEAEKSYLQSVLRSRAKTNPDMTIKELYDGLYEQKHDYRAAQLADIKEKQ